MANKIPWYHLFEWKNLTGTIVTLLIIGAFIAFKFIPDIIYRNKLRTYQGEAVGTIVSIQENKEMSQSDNGTEIYIGSYTISYQYQVNGEDYTSTKNIHLTTHNNEFFNHILVDSVKSIIIRFDTDQPSVSTIKTDTNQ